MVAKRYKQVACFLTPSQHRDLKRLSDKTHIPMQVFLRRAVDEALVRYGVRRRLRAGVSFLISFMSGRISFRMAIVE